MFHTFISFFTTKASAHVGYVIGQGEFTQNLGKDNQYLLSPLSNPKNIFLILVTLVAVGIIYFFAWKIRPIRNWIIALRMRLDTYGEFVPWILRLSVGIALVGASAAGVLVSPSLPHAGFTAIQLIVGFALLSGFLVAPAAILGLVLYCVAFIEKPYLFGNFELAIALFLLLILGNGRPGIDDLLGIPELKVPRLKKYAPLLLRIGIGGALIFLALYEKMLNPHVSSLVVEKYSLNTIIPVGAEMWVLAVGLIEFFVGLFILIGFQTRLVSAVAFFVLCVTFFFFKEEVYSHVTLFGSLSALFITGGGILSLDYFLKRRA